MKLLDEDWSELPWAWDRDDDLGKVLEHFAVVGQTEVEEDDNEYTMFVVVRITNLAEHGVNETGFLVEAELAPHPKHLTEATREKIGGDGDLYDLVTYGLGIPITDVWGIESTDEGYEQVRGHINASSFAPAYMMDKHVNKIGTTGWDLLRDAVDDVDAHRATLDRVLDS